VFFSVFAVGRFAANLLTDRYPFLKFCVYSANIGSITVTRLIRLVIIAALSSVLAEAGWLAVSFWLGLVNLLQVPFVSGPSAAPGRRGMYKQYH